LRGLDDLVRRGPRALLRFDLGRCVPALGRLRGAVTRLIRPARAVTMILVTIIGGYEVSDRPAFRHVAFSLIASEHFRPRFHRL
ncbi:MAG: hypothetical protein ACXVHK_33135, partial [Solirubrobacteraceae bacterium]